MKKALAIMAAFVTVCSFSGCGDISSGNSNPISNSENSEDSNKIYTIDELCVRADSERNFERDNSDRFFTISGEIDSKIYKTIRFKSNIERTSYSKYEIKCEFDDTDTINELSRGDSVTIRGKLDGVSLGTLTLEDCTLIPAENTDDSSTGESHNETSEQSDTSTYKLDTGELLDVKENDDVLIVKAKIKSQLTDKLTINQNYHNAVSIIKSGGDKFKEIQYWAVADMREGGEDKVISFTVPEDVIRGVANSNIAATQLPDLVTDLWVLPRLQQTANTSKENTATSSEQTPISIPQNSEPPAETSRSSTTVEDHYNDYSTPEQQNTTEYVLNTSTLKIHFASCNDVAKIKPENYSTTTDFDWAISNGYKSCGHCHAR